MEFDLYAGEFVLAEGRPFAARHARGVSVQCTDGIVWLTVEGEAGDIVLRAGQSHRIKSNGLAVFEAIGHGRIGLSARMHLGQRLLTRLCGSVDWSSRPRALWQLRPV